MLVQFGFDTGFYSLVYEEKRVILYFGQFIRNDGVFHKSMFKMTIMQIYDKYMR